MSYKINGFIFLCILATTLILSGYFYQVLVKENRDHSVHTLKTSTIAVKSFLDPEILLKLNHPNSYKTKEYQILWDKVSDMKKQLELNYIYVLLLDSEKKPIFILDSGDNPKIFSYRNQDPALVQKFEKWFQTKRDFDAKFEGEILSYTQVYIDAPKEAYLAIENKEFVVAKEYTDQWGTFLSAFSPIIYNGEVIGLIGADYDISYINDLEKRTLYVILSVILFAIFLNFVIGLLIRQIFIKPILSLAESTKLIAQGNLNAQVKMRKSLVQDEVTDLFQNFTFMASRLSENFSRIENYSKEIERLSKTKDEFLANLSHELKTPLAIVYAYSEMLIMGENMLDEVISYSQEIYSSAQKLNDYVSDVILVTDIESNIKLEKSLTSLSDLILNSQKSLISLSDEKEIEWELKIPEQVQFLCDVTLFEKVVFAILKNAVIYNNPKGKILVELKALPTEIQLLVKDTGIGIAKEFHEKVFEKFFRIDSSLTYEVSGVGVGLFIAKRVLELHDGSIELNSSLNAGTEIKVKMPISPNSN